MTDNVSGHFQMSPGGQSHPLIENLWVRQPASLSGSEGLPSLLAPSEQTFQHSDKTPVPLAWVLMRQVSGRGMDNVTSGGPCGQPCRPGRVPARLRPWVTGLP